MSVCTLCPRACGVDREKGLGACHAPEAITLARAGFHFGEEPCLAPKGRGSGAVFFSGCALGCVFCQNAPISGARPIGQTVSEESFCEILLNLQSRGAENIDLVTASHFIPPVARALARIKGRLSIPVVWNCSAYETVESLKLLEGLVDVYLPDFKFSSSELSASLARASDYVSVARAALSEMHRQVGNCFFDRDGTLVRGLLIRHLVLPGQSADSLGVLEILSDLFPQKEGVRLSLMRQFTPMPHCTDSSLSRRVTGLEYSRVTRRAVELGFLGYTQEKESVGESFIPAFDLSGVFEKKV